MNTNIAIFKNERFGEIRVAGTSDEPLFCLADICRVLDIKNVSDCKSRLDQKGIVLTDTLTKGGTQHLVYVNEKNLYKVIMRSDKPQAEDFQDWVCGEILPSIRKHGAYATEETIDRIISDPDYGIKLLTTLKEERAARIEAERRNAILMHVNKTYTATEIAKELNMKSAQELNNKLGDMGIQYKVNKTWVLYSDYASMGYEDIKQEVLDNGKVVYHRKFTQSGRDFILGLFKDNKNK